MHMRVTPGPLTQQEPDEPDVETYVVLVTEADSPIGEQAVLQLILARSGDLRI
jgi:hypothetical protein